MAIDWREDADAALAEAERKGMTTLFDFNAAPD